MNEDIVELELLNPRGEVETVPTFLPSVRVPDLDGKRIGLYSNRKPGMDNLYTVLGELLKERYPTATTTILEGSFEIRDNDAEEWAPEIDAFVYGVGD
ncbi:hypothetical protein ACFL7M_03925 [Thermodesulfobacteriota bacterium]